MRGVDASRAIVASGGATNSRMSRIRSQRPSRRSSPAHPWRAPVRRTLKSHRSRQRWSLVAGGPELPRAVSGCFVPAATFIPRLGDRVLPAGALRATSAKRIHVDLKSNVEGGD